jgi:hypothetical protein
MPKTLKLTDAQQTQRLEALEARAKIYGSVFSEERYRDQAVDLWDTMEGHRKARVTRIISKVWGDVLVFSAKPLTKKQRTEWIALQEADITD